ncbi:hypothetical protein WA158_007382 [Blastocystis sp. Blastoise]
MLIEQININTDCLRQLEEDIVIRGKLLHSFVDCCSSISKLYIHSDTLIKSILNISRNYYETKSDDQINESSISSNIFDEISRNSVTKNGNHYRNKNNDEDFIRFTNSGSLFQISKSIIQSIPYSYIYEASSEESRDIYGNIYLDYIGNEASAYYLLDYLNEKPINFYNFIYEDQLEILDLFEYCNIIIPGDLVFARERRETKKKKIEKEEEIELIINGNKDKIIKDYLVQNGLWKNYIMNYDHGFADYNHIDDSLYMNKEYEYIEYINEYVKNKIIDIEEDKISNIKQDSFEKEMIELFGDQGRDEAKDCIIKGIFDESTIINRKLKRSLMNWLGKDKKWKLLFRASEHNYSAYEFHNYCDNQGETVTLIKHIGHNNHINIFGGYTDQSWESFPFTMCSDMETYKQYSKEFIFTLSNEHGIPPTQYTIHNKDYAINCDPSYGPVFVGDINISDGCHQNSSSTCHAYYYNEVNTLQKSSLFVNTGNANSSNSFIVDDYEVWGRA